jgi:hypothetical protein
LNIVKTLKTKKKDNDAFPDSKLTTLNEAARNRLGQCLDNQPADRQILPSSEITITETSSWYLRRSP